MRVRGKRTKNVYIPSKRLLEGRETAPCGAGWRTYRIVLIECIPWDVAMMRSMSNEQWWQSK